VLILKNEIDISNYVIYNNEADKYIRSSIVNKAIRSSNLSEDDQKQQINILNQFLSYYISIKTQIKKNNSLNDIENQFDSSLNLNIYSMNKASQLTLEERFNGNQNNPKHNIKISSILTKEYLGNESNQQKLMCSYLLDLLNNEYFINNNVINSISLFFNDIYKTTNFLINQKKNEKDIKEFLELKINGVKNQKLINKITYNRNSFENFYLKKEKPIETFSDIAGLEKEKIIIDKYIQAIKTPEIYKKNNARLSTSILFYGPPGTGKSMIVKAMANELNFDYSKIKIPDITSEYFSVSEKLIQNIFDEAKNNGKIVLFFDEIDGIAITRDNKISETSRRIITTFLNNLEEISNYDNVIRAFATNNYEILDPAFKRAGRIDYKVKIPLPDKLTRKKIFEIKINSNKKLSLENNGDGIFDNFSNMDYNSFVELSNNFSGADINEIIERLKIEKSYNESKFKIKKLISSKDIQDMIKDYINQSII
jgi:SpoVK/Ycf46/Vps4 family AAA+-type ATPase